MKKNDVLVMGLGYIGLPTAALIASKNYQVLGVDIKENIIDIINKGEIHIVEPGLKKIVSDVISKNRLRASRQVESADTYIITVPTPVRDNNEPDISYIEEATRALIPVLSKGNLFIIESTSPVGTTKKMRDLIYTIRPELKNEIYMAYCPERVLPGNIIYELENNDRAIGGIDLKSTEKAIDFYRKFVKGNLYPTNARTAEMVKLVENSSRDVQIAFANELSMICDKADINVWELIELANKHPRVQILQPGTGVGGHCIAVDPWFIISKFGKEARLIRTAREINNFKTEWVIERIKNAALEFELQHHKKPVIAALGLAFKPDIDDLRESPALYVARSLKMQGFDILAVEPNIQKHDEFEILDIVKAIEQADIVTVLVGHKEFKNIEIQNKIILDFVNVN